MPPRFPDEGARVVAVTQNSGSTGPSIDGATSAAKWLIAAAGGVLAAAVAGLQLVGLADARSPELAVAAFATVFVAAGATIAAGGRVLMPAYDGLADLSTEQLDMRLEIPTLPPGTFPSDDLSEVEKFGYIKPLYVHLASISTDSPEQLLEERRQATQSTTRAAVTVRITEMLGACNAWEARRRFKAMLLVLVGAGIGVVIAVPTFAWAVSPDDEPESPAIETALAVVVEFASVPDEMHTDACSNEPFTALAVGGTFERPLIRVAPQHECRGGTVRLEPADDYRLADD